VLTVDFDRLGLQPGDRVLDLGCGAGRHAFEMYRRGADVIAFDQDGDELAGVLELFAAMKEAGEVPEGAEADIKEGDALALPFADGEFDRVVAAEILEHVPADIQALDELVRVTRPGGLVVVAYTNWLSPWGGHETSPWHYLGGYPAAERYGRRYGHLPKNRYGAGLFPVSVAAGLRWARSRPDAELVDARPRYLPPSARALLRVPGLREVATWNLWLVLRRR